MLPIELKQEHPKHNLIQDRETALKNTVKSHITYLAVSCDSNSRDLFGTLESLYVLLWCSKKRAAAFREAQKKHSDLK